MSKVRKDHIFPSLEDVQIAFKEYIKKSVPTDAVVISGNGEPTLYSEFEQAAKLIVQLRDDHLPGKPIVVLSNGAHLDSKKVVAGLNLVDERVIKLDAGSDGLLQKINDPLIRLNLAKFLASLHKLKDCTVQSLFCTGSMDNTSPEAIDEWIEVVGMIKPKAIQICTITRSTPLNPGLKGLDEDALYSIAFKLKKRTNLEAQVFCPPKS